MAATAAHAEGAAAPGQANPWRRHGTSTTTVRHGGATASGASVATRSPRHSTPGDQRRRGARRAGGASQIAAVDLERRCTAVQMRHVSPAATAGDGRNNSGKTAATRGSSEPVRARVRARVGEKGSVRPTEPQVARVRVNPLGHPDRWAQGQICLFIITLNTETLEFYKK
jgi:hypothetical protein